MRRSLVVAWGLAMASVLGACGDVLVDGDYRGEPLLTIFGDVSVLPAGRIGDQEQCRDYRLVCEHQGKDDETCLSAYEECVAKQVSEAAPWEDSEGSLRVALFWSHARGGSEEAPQTVEVSGGFPASYVLSVYSNPAVGVLGEGGFGLALPLVYLDRGDDGAWDAAVDRIVGGAAPAGVLYVTEPWGDYGPGMHQVAIPRKCAGGELTLEPPTGGPVDLRLSVAPPHLDRLLPDIDCDPKTVDWPMCSDDVALLENCQAVGDQRPDPWRCGLCTGARAIGGPGGGGGSGGGPGGGGGSGGGSGGGDGPVGCDMVPAGRPCCGDGVCGGPESADNCSADC